MLKRDSFVLHSVIIQHSILLVNLGALYIHLVLPGASRPAFPVYKACVDPWGFSTTDLWTFVPFSQVCFHLSNFLNIFCSISLAKYLDKTTRRSTALNPLDKKIERKKNLYSAHVGALTLWSCIFCYGIFSIVFVIPVMDNASKENNQCLETCQQFWTHESYLLHFLYNSTCACLTLSHPHVKEWTVICQIGHPPIPINVNLWSFFYFFIFNVHFNLFHGQIHLLFNSIFVFPRFLISSI